MGEKRVGSQIPRDRREFKKSEEGRRIRSGKRRGMKPPHKPMNEDEMADLQ